MVHMRRSLLLAALFLAAPLVHADAIDDLVNKTLKEMKVPGASIAIVRDGKILRTGGYGFADVENGVSATPKTVYQIGSVTKQFTSTLIMKLREEGKIDLEKSIREYLPEVPEAWKSVTVRQLLNHTSGIFSYTSLPEMFETLLVQRTDLADIIKRSAAQKPDFAPGESFSYNNTAYFLLGAILEKVSGQSYGDLLKERIFSPLGMSATSVTDWAAIMPHRARGYHLEGGKLVNAPWMDMSWPGAAGNLSSSVEDLAKWMIAQEGAMLKPESWRMMLEPTKHGKGTTPYGFGWALSKVNDHPIIEHGGGIPGFVSLVRRYPTKGIAIVVLTNSGSADATDPIADGIAAHLDPSLKKPEPKPVAAVADPTPELTKRLRGVWESILAEKADKNEFTDQMQQFLFPTRIYEPVKQLKALGDLKEFMLVEAVEEAGLKRRSYRIAFGETKFTLRMAVDREGKIAGIQIAPGG